MSEWGTDLPFAPVPMWVAELPISDRAARLYMLLAGMRDYGTGQASYGRKLLSKKLRCSLDSLDRAKAELEKHEAISVERGQADNGTLARNVYTIHRIPPANRTGAATPIAAQQRLPDSRTGAAMNENLLDESASVSKGWAPQTVSKQRVTKLEQEWTDSLLDLFNERAGKKFSGKSWRESIIRRLREHSDMDLTDHTRLVEEQFAHPWWQGDPSPNVIWGNDRAFDRAVNGVGKKQDEPVVDDYTRA